MKGVQLWIGRGMMENHSSLPLLALLYYLELCSPRHVLTRRQSFTEVAAQPLQLAASPLAPRGSRRKRALFRSTWIWIYVGEPEAAGDGNCWPSGLAVARGFWQGSKWAQWVTLSFPVSLPFYSHFTVSSIPACLPARITSSNRKQMSCSESEVAVLCPSHHQGNTSDIHFHIVGAKI